MRITTYFLLVMISFTVACIGYWLSQDIGSHLTLVGNIICSIVSLILLISGISATLFAIDQLAEEFQRMVRE